MKPARLIAFAALAAALPLAACQQAKEPAANNAPDAKPGLSVNDGVLVLPAVKGNPGVAYFTLTNSGGVATALTAVHVEGAGKAEMHETRGGAMQPLVSAQIDPGATVKFEAGGKHVMVFELAGRLQPGGSTEMTLTFSGGDKLSTPLKVEGAGGGAMSHEDGMEGMENTH